MRMLSLESSFPAGLTKSPSSVGCRMRRRCIRGGRGGTLNLDGRVGVVCDDRAPDLPVDAALGDGACSMVDLEQSPLRIGWQINSLNNSRNRLKE